MVGLALEPHARLSASWCEECGYQLRGLPPGQPCPECGHVPPDVESRVSPRVGWARCVFAGLVLMLVLMLHAVSTVLIQPFTSDVTGTMAALNMPGPKLWAVPLLQRPLGYAPAEPGVVGTRTALLGVLAVWLVTVPCGLGGRMQRDTAMRLLARWGCLIIFGLAFGTLMATQGLYRVESLRAFRALLIAGVELPGTTLLYLYLRRLAEHVPGRERRAAFDRLAWLVPITIAVAAGTIAAQWWLDGNWRPDPAERTSLIFAAGYGTLGVICGAMAMAAVASLAGAYFQLGFPRAGKWVTGARYLWRGTGRAMSGVPTDRARRLGVALGAILLIGLMIIGNDLVLWMTARQGLGGNLPFMNFAGPKVWAGVALGGNGSPYWWNPLVSRTTFMVLHLVALWLVTLPLRDESPGALRRWVRWLPTVCIGAGLAVISTFDREFPVRKDPDSYRTELFALITMVLELPATVLLYTLLARVAGEVGRGKLARQFRIIRVFIPALVGSAFAAFVLSRWLRTLSLTPVVLGICAVYGAAAFAIAAWATGALVRLAGALVMTKLEPREARRFTFSGVAGDTLFFSVDNDERRKENRLASEAVK